MSEGMHVEVGGLVGGCGCDLGILFGGRGRREGKKERGERKRILECVSVEAKLRRKQGG